MKFFGRTNLIMGLAFHLVMVSAMLIAGPEHIAELGPLAAGMGVGTAGAIAARGLKKMGEAKVILAKNGSGDGK